MINQTVKGNLVKLAQAKQFDVIIHGANCFNIMGGGIAKAIKKAFPIAFNADKSQTIKGDRSKLGSFSVALDDVTNVMIINAYTQYELASDNECVLDYKAIEKIFSTLNSYPSLHNMRIGIPKIGCGLAGGDWDKVSSIINRVTPNLNITLVEF